MGLFDSAAKAAREAFKLKQARAIDLFGDGDEVYHWVGGKYVQDKLDKGFSPFTHVGTQKAARDLYKDRELSPFLRQGSPNGKVGATLPLRFNRNKEILDIEKDTGNHSGLSVMWQVAPLLYGNRDSAISAPLVKRTLDSAVDAMDDQSVARATNELVWGGHVSRPSDRITDLRKWLRKKLEETDEIHSGRIIKQASRDADNAARQVLANELEKFNIGALKYTNDVEDMGSTSYMIVQPHDIRSRFANYDWDEWLKRNRDIMAAVPAVAAGGGLLAMSKRDKREREAA